MQSCFTEHERVTNLLWMLLYLPQWHKMSRLVRLLPVTQRYLFTSQCDIRRVVHWYLSPHVTFPNYSLTPAASFKCDPQRLAGLSLPWKRFIDWFIEVGSDWRYFLSRISTFAYNVIKFRSIWTYHRCEQYTFGCKIMRIRCLRYTILLFPLWLTVFYFHKLIMARSKDDLQKPSNLTHFVGEIDDPERWRKLLGAFHWVLFRFLTRHYKF